MLIHSLSSYPHTLSLKTVITQSVRELGERLFSIKSTGPQAKAGSSEADEVLRPLMDLLDGSLTMYAQSCEKTVLKRLLKELWKIVIRTIEKAIVLPPINDKTLLFKNLTDNAKVSSLMLARLDNHNDNLDQSNFLLSTEHCCECKD